MALDKETIEFFNQSRELIEHSYSMQMATNYKAKKFNYSNYGVLLRKALKDIANENEIKQVYPGGVI